MMYAVVVMVAMLAVVVFSMFYIVHFIGRMVELSRAEHTHYVDLLDHLREEREAMMTRIDALIEAFGRAKGVHIVMGQPKNLEPTESWFPPTKSKPLTPAEKGETDGE